MITRPFDDTLTFGGRGWDYGYCLGEEGVARAGGSIGVQAAVSVPGGKGREHENG